MDGLDKTVKARTPATASVKAEMPKQTGTPYTNILADYSSEPGKIKMTPSLKQEFVDEGFFKTLGEVPEYVSRAFYQNYLFKRGSPSRDYVVFGGAAVVLISWTYYTFFKPPGFQNLENVQYQRQLKAQFEAR